MGEEVYTTWNIKTYFGGRASRVLETEEYVMDTVGKSLISVKVLSKIHRRHTRTYDKRIEGRFKYEITWLLVRH